MRVFICYSHQDQAAYSSICLTLDEAGVDRFEPTKLQLGKSLAEQLRFAIGECQVCVFLATRGSIDSGWCQAELGAFWGMGKPVFVYLLDPEIAETDLPKQFQGNLWTRDAEELLAAIRQTLSDRPEIDHGEQRESFRRWAYNADVVESIDSSCTSGNKYYVSRAAEIEKWTLLKLEDRSDLQKIREEIVRRLRELPPNTCPSNVELDIIRPSDLSRRMRELKRQVLLEARERGVCR